MKPSFDKGKRLHWYIVIWRNEAFLRTDYHPHKVGDILGMKQKPENNVRMGLNLKKRDFEPVERYLPLFRGTAHELDNFLKEGA